MNNKLRRDGWRLPGCVDRVASWIGWHIGELAGVIVPGIVALFVTPWAAVLSGVVGACWVAHEVRLARRQAETSAGVPALVAAESEEDDSSTDTAPDPVAGWGDAR